MQYGVCGNPAIAEAAAKAGYDYLETTVQALLKPLEDRQAFEEGMNAYGAAPLPCRVLNCFVPASHPITGPAVDLATLRSYVTTVCSRAEEAGVEVIVFGSGGARRIPDGYPRAQAWQQLVDFGRMLGPIAEAHRITIAVEPLNRNACNVLTTVGESAAYVREVDHPWFRLLVDAYHWGIDEDSAADIVQAGPLLRHLHIATYANHLAPAMEACDFGPFFGALATAGYDGRLSIESELGDPDATLAPALQAMQELVAEARRNG